MGTRRDRANTSRPRSAPPTGCYPRRGATGDKWPKHAAATRRAGRLAAMVKLAASDPRLARRARDFDSDPWLLNTPDRHARPPHARAPAAQPGRRADDADRRRLPARRAPRQPGARSSSASSATTPSSSRSSAGSPGSPRSAPSASTSSPSSGAPERTERPPPPTRSTFALGDYAHAGTVELLLGRHRPGAATPDVADLRGRRLVTVAETREDGRLAAERVKALTGGDPITARHLYAQPFTFQPSHTTWLLTNHRPRVDDDGDAIWRRLLLVPFTVTIPEHERDPELGHRLELEADGILAWIVQGAADYLAHGLNPPASVRAATDEYRQTEDAFAAWLDECTELDPEAFTPTARLRASYAEWAKRNGSEELTSNAITERLTRRGSPASTLTRRNRARGWKGIRLLQEHDGAG